MRHLLYTIGSTKWMTLANSLLVYLINLWSTSMGIAMNNWINLASDRDLYQYWEEYQEFCCSNHTPVVDDLLEAIMDCPVYCEENFVKMIYNTCRDADFSLDDYVHAKRQSGELEARFVACL